MIDLHCHILPDVDDGASDLAEALEMARMAADSGVSTIVATPHCNIPNTPRANYLDRDLLNRFVAFRSAVEEAGIPLRIYGGAEIFCTPQMPQLLQEQKLLPLAGTKYLLVEFFFDEAPEFMEAYYHGAQIALKCNDKERAKELAQKIDECRRTAMTTITREEVEDIKIRVGLK